MKDYKLRIHMLGDGIYNFNLRNIIVKKHIWAEKEKHMSR